MEHERRRFQSMTPKQLETRLGRIKNPEKLANFSAVALEFAERFQDQSSRYLDLSRRAKAKLHGELYSGDQYEIDFSAICRSVTIICIGTVLFLVFALNLTFSIRSKPFDGRGFFY